MLGLRLSRWHGRLMRSVPMFYASARARYRTMALHSTSHARHRTDTGSKRRPTADVLPGRCTFVYVSWTRVAANRPKTHITGVVSSTLQTNSHVSAKLGEVTGINDLPHSSRPRGSA